jgi:hypothetical protein
MCEIFGLHEPSIGGNRALDGIRPDAYSTSGTLPKTDPANSIMLQYREAPASEHELYIRLFITNGGGW